MNTSFIKSIVTVALGEDLAGQEDLTSLIINEAETAIATIITREDMVVCGQDLVDEVFQQIDSAIKINWLCKDGDSIEANGLLCRMAGKAKSLLTGERTALNFLQMLSGVATVTRRYVEKIKGTNAKLLDTRKTIPGMRLAQKYAVRCGGGTNHRKGLYDAFLIKENHIAICGSIDLAVEAAKQVAPNKSVEIEVETLQQLQEAIDFKVDIVMLDNFNLEQMRQAVEVNNGRVKLEVSGNVSLNNIRDIAETGVDYISVGALTKNIKAIDLSMRLESDFM
jgi:nicotinate-nucleotide pyrophosphorylase (carboxylating)